MASDATSAGIMRQYLLQKVCSQRSNSAPPKPAGESDDGKATSSSEGPTISSTSQRMPRTPRTPDSSSSTRVTASTPKIRNNKRKSINRKGQLQETREAHLMAEKSSVKADMLIVDGSSKDARKDGGGDAFSVGNPDAADSQAAATRPEPASRENPRQTRRRHASPGHHNANSQYVGNANPDMGVYMGFHEGYYYHINGAIHPEYAAAYVQNPHAYSTPYAVMPHHTQGYQPSYQPRFEQARYDQHYRHEQPRYEQRPSPFRGGYQNPRHYNPSQYHSSQRQDVGDYRREDGSYYGYTPPKSSYSNTPWNQSRQVSAEHEQAMHRSSPESPVSPRATTAAAVPDPASMEHSSAIQQKEDVCLEKSSGTGAVAEQLDTKTESSASDVKASGHAQPNATVELNVITTPEPRATVEATAKFEELDTAEKPHGSPEPKTVEKSGASEQPLLTSWLDTRKLTTSTGEVSVHKDTTAQPVISSATADKTSINALEGNTPSPLILTRTQEVATAHDSESETVRASPRVATPGEDPSEEVVQQQSSLIVHFAAVGMSEVLPLTKHLLNAYISHAHTDIEIVFNPVGHNWLNGVFLAHRVVIGQSPVLESIMDRREAIDGKPRMELSAGKRFSLLRSFDCALQNLYGLPILEFSDIAKHTRLAVSWGGTSADSVPSHVTALEMNFLIGYMAAGAFMGIEEITSKSFHIMQEYIQWANLETVFHFAQHPEEFLIMYLEVEENPQGKKGGKGNKGKGRKKQIELPPMAEPLNRDIVESFAPKMGSLAAKWLVENMPTNFVFDQHAFTSKSLQDRIPRHLLANTRKGGSLAPTASELVGLETGRCAQPSVAHRLISGILLALPFEQLRETVDLLRREGMLTAKLVREVLQEREQRRMDALAEFIKRQPNKKVRDVAGSHAVLGYREFAMHIETRDMLDENLQEVMHDFTLHREWDGYRTGGEAVPVLKKLSG